MAIVWLDTRIVSTRFIFAQNEEADALAQQIFYPILLGGIVKKEVYMSDTSRGFSNKINSKKFILLYFLVIVLFMGVIVNHFQTATMQNSDSVKINLTGRQRMLTQKISKEALEYSRQMATKEDIVRTAKIFETTLHSLLNGGAAPLDLSFREYIQLPKMEETPTKRQLQQIEKSWQLFRKNVESFVTTGNTSSLEYIIKNNINIMDQIDKAVFMMQTTAERNNFIVNTLLYIIYFCIVIAFVFVLVAKRRQIRNASVYIGRLETILPICVNCKKIREPDSKPQIQESWTAMESYIEQRSQSTFTHGICPGCQEDLYGDQKWYKKICTSDTQQ